MRNYVQPGDMLTVAAPASVSSGQLVRIQGLVGVASGHAANGAAVVIKTEGVFDLAKGTGASTSLAVGDLVYVSATGANVSSSATSNALVGTVVAAAANADTTVRVKLAQ